MSNRRSLHAIPAIGLLFLCLKPVAAQPPAVVDAKTSASLAGRPVATIQDRTVTLIPSLASFQIPQSWISRNRPESKSLHLSAAEIEAVRNGSGEWDTEYATVVNGLFPFEKCSVHAGGEGWGRGGGFGDIQMRAYILDQATPDQIAKKTIEEGAKIAGGLSHLKATAAGPGKVVAARSELEGWTRASVSYDLWYGDYGGTACVDVFAKAYGKQSAVLVFMYCSKFSRNNAEAIDTEIVKSFKM